MKPFRLAVHNDARLLLGYWWLREYNGGYAATLRHPISREFSMVSYDRPEQVLQFFFESYIQYLHALVAQLDAAIAKVPQGECKRPGFRLDHFRRQRRELVSRRAHIICRGRERYAEAITGLRQRGWPTVTPPPCFHMDISHGTTRPPQYTTSQTVEELSDQAS